MRLTTQLSKRLLTSLVIGYCLDLVLTILGLMNMYPADWDELLPGTIIARKIFGGFLNPEGVLGAFVLDGLVFSVMAFLLAVLCRRLSLRTGSRTG